MLLKKLTLLDFRSYKKREFDFSKRLTIIVGPNTSGKTNILESIFLVATGKSFRAYKDSEMITYNKQIARVLIDIEKNKEVDKLDVMLTRGEPYNKKISTKRYLVNGIPKRYLDFVGKLRVSLFWPEDLELITDSPSIRRKYLDFVLTQINREYLRSLRSYEKGIRIRNKILEKLREGESKKEELEFWDHLLIENGSFITKTRKEYIDFLNNRNSSMNGNIFKIFYDKSLISEERLKQYTSEEISAATTLVGPHRDDIKFKINKERDLSLYGSRGEQRLGVLWLKLGELAFIREKSEGEEPVLLLDDIFSEFDHHNRQLVFEHIGNQQTIITTTDIHLIEKKLKEQAQIIQLLLK